MEPPMMEEERAEHESSQIPENMDFNIVEE